jgi:hypothetical protein
MKVEILISGGEVIDLSNVIDYRHLSNVGLGMPPVQLYSEQGPLQHGATYVDYRLQPRDITLVIGAVSSNFTEYMQKRKELLFALKPKSRFTMSLRLTFSETEVYQIDVVYVEGLEFDGNDKSGFYHRMAIVLRAYNPVWYDPNLVTIGISGNVDPNRAVPTSIPLQIGTGGFNNIVNVPYMGTYDSFPVIKINGPCTYFYIRHEETQDSIELNASISQDTLITIDTNYGQKTITDQDGTNYMQYYSGDLATFRLVARETNTMFHENSFYVLVGGVSEGTKVFFQYFTRFIGV